ncbi:MAG TPA: hypothetical protein VFD91_13885 [Mariniphaga sp.]|nr:hypothetical protein [Mariniphaga sp.]
MIKKRFKIGLFLLLNMSILQAENVPSCYAVFSTEDLKIGDRAGTDGNGIVGSNSQVLVGHDATIVGSVVSAGNTMLYDRANIQGNIT